MTFSNPIVGGTTLIRPAIHSPDYVSGSAGWSINKDGSAEFNDVTVRGDGNGEALIVGPDDGPQVKVGSTSTAGYIQFPTNRPVENKIATVIAATHNLGAVNEYETLQIQGPTVDGAGDQVELQLNSQNNDGSSQANAVLKTGSGSLHMDEDRLALFGPTVSFAPSASAGAAMSVDVGDMYTGSLMRTTRAGEVSFAVNTNGVIGTYGSNQFDSYTPTVIGGGTATYVLRNGWYQRLGSIVFFNAYIVVGSNGSGAGSLQLTTPTNIDRSTRQVFKCYVDSNGAQQGSFTAVTFTGGSGNVIDRIRNSVGAPITGGDIIAGALITIQGWYREA